MSRWAQRLLVPVTIAAVLLIIAGGWLSSPPGTQLRIIREIRAAGGVVKVIRPAPVGWFGRIKSALPDAFGDVHEVSLADVPVRQHWLRAFQDWKKLNTVWLNRSSIVDADLVHLSSHAFITELYLNGNPITDSGLLNLRSKPRLRHLELNWTRVRQLDSVKRLFPQLQVLKLRGTFFSDPDVKGLEGYANLVWLDLSRTRITDAGLLELGRLRRFQQVDLKDTPTTYLGARRLQAELPNSHVHTSHGQTISPETRRKLASPRRLWIAPKMFR